jgi:hypothetical protein
VLADDIERRPTYYGQLELGEMQLALNALWPRRTLNWSTSDERQTGRLIAIKRLSCRVGRPIERLIAIRGLPCRVGRRIEGLIAIRGLLCRAGRSTRVVSPSGDP